MASDDRKRTEVVTVKVTERMADDLDRNALADDRSLSDFIYRLLRQHLYGSVIRLDAARAVTRADVVDPDA